MIRFDHVTRRYQQDGRPALDDISIEFERGDFVFLIGASGSGKSTLLRMILREGLPQKGKITVAGQNLGLMLERRVPDFRRSIGMVFQDFRLLPDKTVFENVAFAMRVIGAPRAKIRKRVTKVLERVNLDHLAKRYPHEISGGEQQRAAIARAIVNEPAILLADEPTGNLDPRAAEEVMKILRWISASGTTVIMATHDRPIVDRMRRRVVQLHRGVLVRDEQRGTYDPPAGSQAWTLLREEEASSGLRASDPAPAAVAAQDAVSEKSSASEKDPGSEEESAPAEDRVPEEAPVPEGAPVSEEAPAPEDRAEAEAEEPDVAPEQSAEEQQHEDFPEDAAAPAEERERPAEEGIRVVWPQTVRQDSAALEVPEPQGGFDGTELPDLGRDGYEEPAPDEFESVPEEDPELVEDGPQPPPPEQEEPGPAAQRHREPKKHRLDWLSHPEAASAENNPVRPAGGPAAERSAEENTRRLDRPASSPAYASPPQTPRPKSSASQSTYTDARRTAEQLGITKSRRGLWRRRRGDG